MNSLKKINIIKISEIRTIEDIIKIYRGATITFKVTTSITKNGFNQNSAFWMFHIYSNEDYDLSQGL